MSGPTFNISRRGLLAGGLLAAVTPLAAPAVAAAATTSTWMAYEAKLRARLADAGGGVFETAFAQDLLAQVNAFRRNRRLPALRWDEGLATCARAHAADMARGGYFAHESQEGFTHVDRAALLTRDLCGAMTENLAWREHTQRSTPRDMEELWENSPGHRENLLDPKATHAGYGVVRVRGAYHAVGVYADAEVRLASPLPLRLKAGATLASTLAGAAPQIERLAVTAPGRDPTQLAPPLNQAPPLRPGVWQLRPMLSHGGPTFNVLSGPVIFVG